MANDGPRTLRLRRLFLSDKVVVEMIATLGKTDGISPSYLQSLGPVFLVGSRLMVPDIFFLVSFKLFWTRDDDGGTSLSFST